MPTRIYETKMDLFFNEEEWEQLKNILVVGEKIQISVSSGGIKFTKGRN